MVLEVDELRFGRAVREGHVLQFALAAGVAYRAIQRMVTQQQLDHGLARLLDLVGVGGDDHAFGDPRGACGLQLGHLLDSHQAHAARALQRKIRVVAERRHLDAGVLAGLNEQSPRGSGDSFAVDSEVYGLGESAI